MRVALLTSVGQRHAYMAHQLHRHHDLALVVREEKGLDTFYEKHPDREVIADHFARLARTEEQFFGSNAWDDLSDITVTVPRGKLNTEEIAGLLRDRDVSAVAVFGCGIIKSPVIEQLPSGRTFNLHQGLSPYYRGSGTNFWPFVEERPEYIGVTLHLIDPGIDTGGIVAHARPDIEVGDTLHTLGCKTIIKSYEVLSTALEMVELGQVIGTVSQWSKGKLYKRADVNGEAIRRLRKLEDGGFIADFIKRREQGLVPPVQLVRLEK